MNDTVMEVRSRGQTRLTYLADDLPSPHCFTWFHTVIGQMTVDGLKIILVAQVHRQPEAVGL